jgi:lipase maturation factor 1
LAASGAQAPPSPLRIETPIAYRFLEWAHRLRGGEAVLLLPTLGWLGAGDTALSLMCHGGAAAAALAALGFSQGPLFAVCFALYLSLVHLGQTFLSFQWDILLTETGFLALLLAPWDHLRPRRPSREPPPAPVAIWLLRVLVFKLMWSSGVTKLAWGDPTWRNLTALDYHYWTQPIPNSLSWYANQLPPLAQRVSCALMLAVELVVPFLVFAPRRPRLLAFWAFVILQLAIGATGNYGFFNLLSFALCLSLLDDHAFPAAVLMHDTGDTAHEVLSRPRRPLVTVLAVLLVLLDVPPLLSSFNAPRLRRLEPRPLRVLTAAASPFFIRNSCGLFRVMTTTRPEIQVEARAEDGDWTSLPFRYKPGDPARAPRFFAPHMPRLDRQMWFAALRAESLAGASGLDASWLQQGDPWLARLVEAVLRGDQEVLALLGPSPFCGHTSPRGAAGPVAVPVHGPRTRLVAKKASWRPRRTVEPGLLTAD